MHASHHAELDSARKTNGELQDRLQSMTSEMLQLKSSLMEITTERDGIKENLRCHFQSKTEESCRAQLKGLVVKLTDSFWLGVVYVVYFSAK